MSKILAAFGLTLLATGTAFAEERQARIEVGGLWCPSCSYMVGEALKKEQSVEVVAFEERDGGKTGVYTIAFDDALTGLEAIVARPAEYGYGAVVLEDASGS